MHFPDELLYTEEHEWLRVEGSTGVVGITDYAQHELTDIVFVELPEVGTAVQQGKPFGTVEAIKAVSDLYSPVDGTVTEINSELEAHPEWVNEDPYGRGWMIKIELSDPAQTEKLLSAEEYRKLVGEA